MAYFEIARLREIILGSITDPSEDTLLNAKGAQADSEIDDELYILANKYSKLQALPALPLTGTLLTQSIKDAATDRAASLAFLQRHAIEMADRYMTSSREAVKAYVLKLEYEGEIFSANV